jgi:phosphomevalonate kinase
MNKIEIQELADNIQLELLKLDKLDLETQKKVDNLQAYLRQLQERNPTAEEQTTLSNSLDDVLTEFEVSHPSLTNLINQFMLLLSNVGI